MGDLKGGECSLAVSWSTEIVSECGKGGDLIEPSDDVREVLSGGLIDHESESTIGNEGGLNVSNGQTISNEELGCLEVAVQDLESSEKISMSLSSLLSFQGVPSEDRNDKADEYGFHFGCNEINPLINKRFLVVVLTIKASCPVCSCDITKDGVALKDGAILCHQDWDLAKRVSCKMFFGFQRFKRNVHVFNGYSSNFSSEEKLVTTRVSIGE